MTYDFAPLFRTAIGFDRLARLVDTATEAAAAPSYPPYNIAKTGEETYTLTMAVAGFGPEDIELTVRDNTLFVTGRAGVEQPRGDLPSAEILYRGIAGRAFERRFVLADHIVVDGADLKNGLLQVALKRVVPEALKPRRISIGQGSVHGASHVGTQAGQSPAIANDATVADSKAA
jgi:molecular chaperone IbpA